MFKSFHSNRMDGEGTFPNGTNQDKPEDLDDLLSRVCEELYGNQLENLSRSKLFGCLFCDFCPKTKQDLKTHINTVHKKYLCIICGKLFGKKEFFTLHLKIHEKSQKKKTDSKIMESFSHTNSKKKSQTKKIDGQTKKSITHTNSEQKSLKKKIDGKIMKSSTNTALKRNLRKKIKCLTLIL